MRWFFLVLAIAVVATIYAIGPRGDKFSDPPFELFPDMDDQYKLRPQEPSQFFAGGQAAQKPVAGTVPLGYDLPHSGNDGKLGSELEYSSGDSYVSTGQFGDFFGEGYPEEVKLTPGLVKRGQERYQVFCTPCHGETGNGQGVVSKYWAIPPTANILDARVSAMPEGQIFSTITHGKGLMGPYNGVIPIKDRWAIVSYVKSLQAASGN